MKLNLTMKIYNAPFPKGYKAHGRKVYQQANNNNNNKQSQEIMETSEF